MKEKADSSSAAVEYNYAPVVIPTLNRFVHFKRCLESLERCTGADKTDVYVGLDYPPSEKFVEGWKQIDQFLTEKECSNGFRNLYVRRRVQNCGVSKKGSNFALLMREIRQKYDTYISTEDDNEFSPNFLEYINWGLIRFKNRDDVMAISGYLFPEVIAPSKTSSFLACFSNAWGTGYWVEKKSNYMLQGGRKYAEKILSSWRLSLVLYRKRASSLNGLLSMHFRKKYYGDVVRTSEMLLESKYSLFPTISKVRNWGHDGSGIHTSVSLKFEEQPIDDSIFFEGIEENIVMDIAHYVDFGLKKKVATFFRYVAYRLTGYDIMSFYWSKRI